MNEKNLVQFTEYMNAKVLKDKFTLEHSETELVFLDTKAHLKNEVLNSKNIFEANMNT